TTLPWLEVVDVRHRGGLAHPLDQLPVRDQVYVAQCKHLVEEAQKAISVVGGGEPAAFEEESKRSAVGVIVPFEVAHDQPVDAGLVGGGGATVAAGAAAPAHQVLPHHQSDLPKSYKGS